MTRRRVLFAVLLIALALVAVSRREPEITGPAPVTWEAKASGSTLRTPTSESPAPPRLTLAQAKSHVLTDEEEIEKDDQCWARIYQEAESEKDFLAHHEPELCRTVGRWYFDSEVPAEPCANAAPSEKFFLALAKAGLLDGRKVKRDDDEALALLDEVIALDPQNSAPLVYQAIIYRRQHRPDDEARVVDRIANATHFDSYLKAVTRSVYAVVQTPSDYLNARGLWAKAPVPDYTALSHYVVDRQLGLVGDQMLEDSRRGLDHHETRWVPIEAAIGIAVLKKTEPGRRDLPEFRDLASESQRGAPPTLWGGHPPPNCRLEELAPEVEALRQELR